MLSDSFPASSNSRNPRLAAGRADGYMTADNPDISQGQGRSARRAGQRGSKGYRPDIDGISVLRI
jgi:hypothetical protein